LKHCQHNPQSELASKVSKLECMEVQVLQERHSHALATAHHEVRPAQAKAIAKSIELLARFLIKLDVVSSPVSSHQTPEAMSAIAISDTESRELGRAQ